MWLQDLLTFVAGETPSSPPPAPLSASECFKHSCRCLSIACLCMLSIPTMSMHSSSDVEIRLISTADDENIDIVGTRQS